VYRDDIIDLGIGQPDNAILPRELLRRAAMSALAGPDNSYLQYAPEEGADSLRRALAGFLSRRYGSPVPAEELLVTGGASHGFDLVLGGYTKPGDTVIVEAPTYFFGLDVLRGRNVRLIGVPTDAEGLDVEELARTLRRTRPALIYTIPVFHNPTGVTLTPARRQRLVDLAARHDCLVVADEVYQLVAARDRVPDPMRRVGGDQVLSLGSFSKILGPGVRLGWVECSARHVATLRQDGVLRSGGGANPLTGAIVEAAIRAGLQDEFLDTVREVYDRRRRHAIDVLRRVLPEDVRVIYPAGGYYIWLELPGPADTVALMVAAKAAGVGFRPGPIFSLDGGFANCLRLCFTYYDEDHLTLAGERLGSVLHSHLSTIR